MKKLLFLLVCIAAMPQVKAQIFVNFCAGTSCSPQTTTEERKQSFYPLVGIALTYFQETPRVLKNLKRTSLKIKPMPAFCRAEMNFFPDSYNGHGAYLGGQFGVAPFIKVPSLYVTYGEAYKYVTSDNVLKNGLATSFGGMYRFSKSFYVETGIILSQGDLCCPFVKMGFSLSAERQ